MNPLDFLHNIGSNIAKWLNSTDVYQANFPENKGKMPKLDIPKSAPQQTLTSATTQAPVTSAPTALPTPQMNLNHVIPEGTASATQFIGSHTPNGANMADYYPALKNPQFVKELVAADKKRPGLSNLLLWMAFNESTLGRGTNNIFGVKPTGSSKQFDSPLDALHYQLGGNVLGGGANQNMNVLGSSSPLTLNDVVNLYKSYNPEGDYLHTLPQAFGGGN